MQQHGFQPDFPPEVPQQLAELRAHPPQIAAAGDIRDLRNLLWSSIDNDTSRDLDQIEVAERASNGDVKVMVGIADVDAFVPKQTAIDQHAARETTTVYAGVRNFPMLPEELSTGQDFAARKSGLPRRGRRIRRRCHRNGERRPASIARVVRNKAQLQYNSAGRVAGREGTGAAEGRRFQRFAGPTETSG